LAEARDEGSEFLKMASMPTHFGNE
jgi:hypothetical protein